jgi:hypothetical protein
MARRQSTWNGACHIQPSRSIRVELTVNMLSNAEGADRTRCWSKQFLCPLVWAHLQVALVLLLHRQSSPRNVNSLSGEINTLGCTKW